MPPKAARDEVSPLTRELPSSEAMARRLRFQQAVRGRVAGVSAAVAGESGEFPPQSRGMAYE